jgi:undecaprenyl-diphosphatase
MNDWLNAIILGVVEGLTEFLPVSSTAHLLLAEKLLGVSGPVWETFTVLIQLGAILAVVGLYFQKLLKVALTLGSDRSSRRFALSVLIAFLPAAVIGAGLHKLITGGFFENMAMICWALLIGGFVLLAVDRWPPKPKHFDATRYPFLMSLGIGLFQCLSIVPGTSRSGATIVGALLQRADKRSAAEFSFFLAIPTMTGAFVVQTWSARHELAANHGAVGLIAVGFIVSFISALVVVKTFIDFVGRHGLAPFAYWRIVIGAVGLLALANGWGR